MPESIKIVFLSDTHLGFDYPVRPRVVKRRRGGDFFGNFRRVLDYAARTRPDVVVHGGDLYFRSRVPSAIVDMAYADLTAFAQHGIPLVLVPGNHERSRLPTSLWLTDPNIHVFDSPRTFHIPVRGHMLGLSGFPCIRDNVRLHVGAALDETGWRESPADVNLLCMHQTVEGARVGPSDFTFRRAPDVLAMVDIPTEFAMVLSGHIHRRQILTRTHSAGAQPIVYPGSIERTSFAEKDEPKGFFEIQLARDADGSWSAYRVEFREVPTRPMIELDIDPGIAPSKLPAYLAHRVSEISPDAIVRVRCPGRLDDRIPAMLTAAFVRSVFPSSMDVELGGLFKSDRLARR